MKRLLVATFVLGVACQRAPAPSAGQRYDVGRPATAAEISAWNTDVGPDGEGLPHGSGTVARGTEVFATTCASCHGARGEGKPPLYPRVIGRDPRSESFGFATDPSLVRTIGDYWPYATTIFDYVRRAMPPTAPGSLSSDDTYAVTAYLLAANRIIPMDATLDSASLVAVKMPAAGRFVPDSRRGGREVR